MGVYAFEIARHLRPAVAIVAAHGATVAAPPTLRSSKHDTPEVAAAIPNRDTFAGADHLGRAGMGTLTRGLRRMIEHVDVPAKPGSGKNSNSSTPPRSADGKKNPRPKHVDHPNHEPKKPPVQSSIPKQSPRSRKHHAHAKGDHHGHGHGHKKKNVKSPKRKAGGGHGGGGADSDENLELHPPRGHSPVTQLV